MLTFRKNIYLKLHKGHNVLLILKRIHSDKQCPLHMLQMNYHLYYRMIIWEELGSKMNCK